MSRKGRHTMNIRNIAANTKKQTVFEPILEEACRQWCDCIDDAPERKDGAGFAKFFYEIFEDKWRGVYAEMKKNGQILKHSEPER